MYVYPRMNLYHFYVVYSVEFFLFFYSCFVVVVVVGSIETFNTN